MVGPRLAFRLALLSGGPTSSVHPFHSFRPADSLDFEVSHFPATSITKSQKADPLHSILIALTYSATTEPLS
jgi:hypothetical protein